MIPSLYFVLSALYSVHQAIVMASKDPKKSKHVILIIPQKLEIIRELESCKS
jgi:hypothetical protein